MSANVTKNQQSAAPSRLETDEMYMRRCLQLAACGHLGAPPNPMVGAVVVWRDRIIGEGYHRRCGGPHAEVNAIGAVRDPSLLPESTIYVSLEPCAHVGRTPPCADLIIRHRLRRVVVGCQDPFARVDGLGIKKLREAGIEVTVGVLEAECLALNARFITFHTLHRPLVTLKWAQSSDGYIAREGEQTLISTPTTSALVHRLRATHQAILVGARTALIDDPSLTTRLWPGPSPLRVVLAREGSLPKSLRLFTDGAPTEVCPPDDLPALMSHLYARGIQTLLVEGGARTHQRFIDAGLWDKAVVELSPQTLGGGTPAARLAGARLADQNIVDGHYIIRYTRG